jgi:hypothetical protein
MNYKFIQQFTPFNQDEIVSDTDLRFGSKEAKVNQPHIDHLLEAKIIEKSEVAPVQRIEPKTI